MDQFLSLSGIIAKRDAARRAIDNARTVIAEQEVTLRELEVAERIVKRFGSTAEPAFDYPKPPEAEHERGTLLPGFGDTQPEVRIRRRNGDTVESDGYGSPTEGYIIAVLREKNDPWTTANEIQEWASTLKGTSIPMSTVSPVLTRLKNDGVIVREGLKVALAERLNEYGTPTVKRQESHTVRQGSTAGSEDADRKEAADA